MLAKSHTLLLNRFYWIWIEEMSFEKRSNGLFFHVLRLLKSSHTLLLLIQSYWMRKKLLNDRANKLLWISFCSVPWVPKFFLCVWLRYHCDRRSWRSRSWLHRSQSPLRYEKNPLAPRVHFNIYKLEGVFGDALIGWLLYVIGVNVSGSLGTYSKRRGCRRHSY